MAEVVELRSEKAIRVLCYPRADVGEYERRVRVLKSLGVSALVSKGRVRINEMRVLGKGGAGVVVAALVNGDECAVKIRRVDASRKSLLHEAEMLKKANSVGVGPRLIKAEADFLIMQYIEGETMEDWLMRQANLDEFRELLLKLLTQCYALDKIGLDHGELTRAKKHIRVVDKNPYILDFETASTSRRPKNLTSVIQYVFMREELKPYLPKEYSKLNVSELQSKLRAYKKSPDYERFREILKLLRVGEIN